jgi:hypothetical protein
VRRRVCLCVWLAMSTAGCATKTVRLHSGAASAPDRSATIQGTLHRHYYVFSFKNRITRVLAVDGIPLPKLNAKKQPDDRVQVDPGRHDVRAVLRETSHFVGSAVIYDAAPQDLVLHALPGHRYRVDAKSVDVTASYRAACYWIEDIDTGQVVAGSQTPKMEQE